MRFASSNDRPALRPSWPVRRVLSYVLLGFAALYLAFQPKIVSDTASDTRTTDSPAVDSKNSAVEISKKWISLDTDQVSGFRDRSGRLDANAYYYLVDLARRNDPAAIESAARTDIAIPQLLADPADYRGEIIRLKGQCRRHLRHKAEENPYGIVEVSEVWIFNPAMGPRGSVVVMAEPPAGIPIGESINVPIEIAGYFLGIWRHETKAENKVSQSPILMAHRVVPNSTQPAQAYKPPSMPIAIGLPFSLLLIVGLVYHFLWIKRVDEQQTEQRINELAEPDWSQLGEHATSNASQEVESSSSSTP